MKISIKEYVVGLCFVFNSIQAYAIPKTVTIHKALDFTQKVASMEKSVKSVEIQWAKHRGATTGYTHPVSIEFGKPINIPPTVSVGGGGKPTGFVLQIRYQGKGQTWLTTTQTSIVEFEEGVNLYTLDLDTVTRVRFNPLTGKKREIKKTVFILEPTN